MTEKASVQFANKFFFGLRHRKERKYTIFCLDREKALEYGFTGQEDNIYSKELSFGEIQDCISIKEYVKYKGYFCLVISRKNDMIEIAIGDTTAGEFFQKEDDNDWYWYHGDADYRAEVPRKDVIEMKDVKEKVGILNLIPYTTNTVMGIIVVEIADESDTQYLVRTNERDCAIPYIKEDPMDFYIGYESEDRDHNKNYWIKSKSDPYFHSPIQVEAYHQGMNDLWEKKGDWYYKWVSKDGVVLYEEILAVINE